MRPHGLSLISAGTSLAFSGRSRTCPTLASTRYSSPRRRASVRALAGDSTMTSGFDIGGGSEPPTLARRFGEPTNRPPPMRRIRPAISSAPSLAQTWRSRPARWRAATSSAPNSSVVVSRPSLGGELGQPGASPVASTAPTRRPAQSSRMSRRARRAGAVADEGVPAAVPARRDVARERPSPRGPDRERVAAVISEPLRSAAWTTTTARHRPLRIRLRSGK